MSIFQRIHCLFAKRSYPLIVFTVSRLYLFLLVYLSLILIPVRTGEGLWRAYPHNLFLDGWARWDSGWYADIAEEGYTNTDHPKLGSQRDTVFFPFYPLSVRIVKTVCGDVFISGMLISNCALLIASIVLFRIARDNYSMEVAQGSVILLAFNPFSFFFSAVYSEALFLLAILCAFYFGERKRWGWAAISAVVAGATRVVGFLAIIGLMVLYFEEIEYNWRRIRLNILWLLLGIAGPGGYMVFLALKFGDPLQFVRSQYVPGRAEGVNIQSAIDTIQASLSSRAIFAGQFPAINLIHLLSFIFALSVLLMVIRRLRPAYFIWAVLTILASFSMWIGMGRYLLVVFPLYIATPLLLTGKQFRLLVALGVLLMNIFAVMFTHWYWVA